MSGTSRRDIVVGGTGLLFIGSVWVPSAMGQTGAVTPARHQLFIDEAERMRQVAVAAGDQSYGAVVVSGGEIVGWGPSRVIVDRSLNAHAERVAIWDAQARTGRKDLAGAVLYSTSRACSVCEGVAARAGISRMYWGAKGSDAGVPRG